MSIVINTPLWVWFIPAFLLYKGIRQIKSRAVNPFKLFIFPAIFFPLTIISIINAEQPFLASCSFILGIIFGLFIGKLIWQNKPLVIRQNNGWVQKGSYFPLSLYDLVFVIRYILSVLQHIGHSIIHTDFFNIMIGFPIGIGLGLLSAIPLFRQTI